MRTMTMNSRISRSRRKYYGLAKPRPGQEVILLNADYTYLHIVKWRDAVKLIEKGKVQVLKLSERIIRNFERTREIAIPLLMRLVKMVRTLYKNKVPYSKRNVFIRDGFVCSYCPSKPSKLTLEHIVPRDQGGKSTWENTVAACKPCNDRKANRTPREAGMYLKKQPYAPTINEFLQIRIRRLGINDLLQEYLASL